MTTEFIIFLTAGAFLGGFVNGLAGFGTSLFALGLFLQVMTPLEAVPITVLLSVVGGIPGMVVSYRHIEAPRLGRFLIPAFLGIPIGLYLLHVVDARALKLTVAAFLLLYGLYFLIRRGLPQLRKDYPVIDVGIGFASGILGAVAGLSGALPSVWLSMRPWPKLRTRALLQPFNVIILASTAAVLLFQGAYTGPVALAVLVAVPTTIIASQIGIHIFKRLEDSQFQRLLIGLVFLSGIGIIAREVLL
jgi:uncharacterized membrane protein YfcA